MTSTQEPSKCFTDKLGRTWTVEISVASIKRVKSLLNIDLTEVYEDGPLLRRLVTHPIDLCNVLYALCKPEADAQSISDEKFGAGMSGKALADGSAALREAIVSFPANPEVRANLRRVLEAHQVAEMKLSQVVGAKMSDTRLEKIVAGAIAQAEEEMERRIASLEGTSGASSTDTPAS